jgi:hypothetical protein
MFRRWAVLAGLILAGSALALDQSPLDAVLKKSVSSGRVDYAAVRASKAELDRYLQNVASVSGEQKLGFYLDAYDGIVLDALADQDPLPAKVTDVAGFFDAQKHTIAGNSWTLNDLETHIRAAGDPRIHFALNCGARSCPPLQSSSFPEDPTALDVRLDLATSAFLNGSGVRIDDARREIAVSSLFDWYKADFEKKDGSVQAFLLKHVSDPAKAQALKTAFDAGYVLTYQSYDWTPNAK